MKRRPSKGTTLDVSIRGDQLEHDRIQLEHNLQHTDLSFHLSSAPDDEYHNSVEYPRHNSGPSPFPDFASFEQRSRDHFDGDTHSQLHAWSYRTADDEEGINPYAGETMSTAAHHASALTLSAGLGGGRGHRREVSLSGAEYDPDRPLYDMIAGVDSKLSVFEMDPSKSRYPGASIAFDPLVVDSTAELDRVLQSGHAAAPGLHSRSVRLISPQSSSTSSSPSDSDNPNDPTSRPKLSDALRRVSFSPKRPRSAQSNRSHSSDSHHKHSQLPDDHNHRDAQQIPTTSQHQHIPSSPLARPHSSMDYNAPTPKVRHTTKRNIFPSYTSTQPEVRLLPPTPSTVGSKFTKMARGLARELEVEAEQSRWHSRAERSRTAAPERNPFSDIVNYPSGSADAILQPTPRRGAMKSQSGLTPNGKVHLPDVTGLTSAVESPAKTGLQYYPYNTGDRPRESEARLLSTLSTVQSKLLHLEEENSISRRRVRELELELEVCKREVARERTRVMEREDVIVQHQREVERAGAGAGRKGKARARDVSGHAEDPELTKKYREIVEEKKALEALIATLRTHLTRLTSELSSHQELLTELRLLRESDSRALKEKSIEVHRLREEVERLAGEVEVLRGVVEEGLKERRAVRDGAEASNANVVVSEDSGEQGEVEETQEEGSEEGEPEEDDEPFDPLSILGSSRANVDSPPDKTMRTDHATVGSSNLAALTPRRFIENEELVRISAEVNERRSDHSGSVLSQSRSRMGSRSPSPARQRKATVEDVPEGNNGRRGNRAASPTRGPFQHTQTGTHQLHYLQPSTSRPAVPTQAHASGRRPNQAGPSSLETPFPQIRGAHLERLFFSAPEHNAKTCTLCHRRRRPGLSSPLPQSSPSWPPSRADRNFRTRMEDARDDDDEGFVEGSDEGPHERIQSDAKGKGKQREHVTFSEDPGPWRNHVEREGGSLPPQTVLARVIKELEDDFTHYKSIYVELADQYKDMDAASNVPKRNTLAAHLREVVDILEQKGDQIASLYDLLDFKDKPISESVVPDKTRRTPAVVSSWGRNEGRKNHETFVRQ